MDYFFARNQRFIIKALIATDDKIIVAKKGLPTIEALNQRFYLIKMDETRLKRSDIIKLVAKQLFDKYQINIIAYEILQCNIDSEENCSKGITTINIEKI